jgi:hypothetical protein
MLIGADNSAANGFPGYISNIRLNKGEGLYSASFRPTTEPLTTTSQGSTANNVKILACNNSSITGGTVLPATVNSGGGPTASIDSPFDDPAGFKFGDSKEGVIKCGSYVGDSTNYPEINLGWEPQWILWKCSSNAKDWKIVDCMRGIVTGGNDPASTPNQNIAEDSSNWLEVIPTGWKITSNSSRINENGYTYVWMAIRRPDGYVGKPVETATSVFAMDAGAGNSTTPNFDSGFPVDFAFSRDIDTTDNWYTFARLTGKGFMYLQGSGTESDSNDWSWDSNVGWQKANWGSDKQSWQWKRHAGFDVVTYKGDGSQGRQIPHSLSKSPEMMWVKNRDATQSWSVWHKGLNGGVNVGEYYLILNATNAEGSAEAYWQDTAPTSTHFTLGNSATVNGDGNNCIAMLFASVDGISKVGYYDGSSSAQTITTGFQPRFVILKRVDNTGEWYLLDTTRGWGSGNDKVIKLNNNQVQFDHDMGAPTSTGFSLTNHDDWNNASKKYIYYAHA